MSMIFDLCEVEEKIKYTFRDKNLLRQAFTHSSYSNEQKGKSNEELEFLGDSILNFVVADYLYRKYPEWNEGELTKTRAGLVSATPLSEVIEGLDLTRHILLGVGESKLKTHSYNISADLFEAVTAAIYLDGGLENARAFISMSLLSRPCGGRPAEESADCKSRLMELSQKLFKSNVQYRLLSQTGPAHEPIFTVQAIVNGEPYAKASGKSKKAAEQQAAQLALEKLEGGSDDRKENSVSAASAGVLKPIAASPSAYEWRQTRFDPSDDAFVDIYAEDFEHAGGRKRGRKPSVSAAFGSTERADDGKSVASGPSAGETSSAGQRGKKKSMTKGNPQKRARGTRTAASASAAKVRSGGNRQTEGREKGGANKNVRSDAVRKNRRNDTGANKPVRAATPAKDVSSTNSNLPVGKKFTLPRWLGKKD